jgi:hypothetical protein
LNCKRNILIGKEKTKNGWKLSIPAAFKVGHDTFWPGDATLLHYLEQIPIGKSPVCWQNITLYKALEIAKGTERKK